MLNPPSGDMYPNCYTWNPMGGRCPHDCGYCYVNRLRNRFQLEKYMGPLRVVDKEFNTSLKVPNGYMVFVESCGDLFAEEVPDLWVLRVLDRVRAFPDTKFLLQSKNPKRYLDFEIPDNCVLGTTIETNRSNVPTKAPQPIQRYEAMTRIPREHEIMVSMEPIMDFDLTDILIWMGVLNPNYVSVGGDSGHNNLLEPPSLKLRQLLWQLELITEVKKKKNLGRLLKEE